MKRLLLVIAALLLSLEASAAVKVLAKKVVGAGPCATDFVQSVLSTADYNGVTPPDALLDSPPISVTAGNGLVVVAVAQQSFGIDCDESTDTVVTDTGGNTYTNVAFYLDSSTQCITVFYAGVTTAMTNGVVTATLPRPVPWNAIFVLEYTNVLAGNFGTASGATPVTVLNGLASACTLASTPTACCTGLATGPHCAPEWNTPTIVRNSAQSLLIGVEYAPSSGGTSNAEFSPAVERIQNNTTSIVVEDIKCSSSDQVVGGVYTGIGNHIAIGFAIKRAP